MTRPFHERRDAARQTSERGAVRFSGVSVEFALLVSAVTLFALVIGTTIGQQITAMFNFPGATF